MLGNCDARHGCTDGREGACSHTGGHLGKHLCSTCLRFFSSADGGFSDQAPRCAAPAWQEPRLTDTQDGASLAAKPLTERQNAVLQFLQEQGYNPRLDKTGWILFSVQGLTYVVIMEDADAEYIQIALPNIYRPVEARETGLVLYACCKVSARVKVAKVCLIDTMVVALIELFCSPFESFKRLFPRCLTTLTYAAESFWSAAGIHQAPDQDEGAQVDQDEGQGTEDRKDEILSRLSRNFREGIGKLVPAMLAKQDPFRRH